MDLRHLVLARIAGFAVFVAAVAAPAAERPRLVPAPELTERDAGPLATAYFAGGCFWGVEAVFDHVKGVREAVSGYAGGTSARPDYDSVSTGQSGHAETVRVRYDPQQVRYADLLRIYFSVVADPTQRNRQGPDVGTQYRTALFPVNRAQERQARAYIAQLDRAGHFGRPIVTTIERGARFTPAEAYHQDYMARHPDQPYIVVNDRPKVEALRRLLPQHYRGKAAR